MKLFCVILLISLFIISGCTTGKVMEFTIMSNKNIGTHIEIPAAKDLPIVQGKSEMKTYFIIPSGKQPTIGDALKDALNKGKGEVIINGSVEMFSNMYFPFIYMEQGYIVTGKVISTAGQ